MKMEYNNNEKKYLIIADDFTGANDTAVQVRKRGYNIKVTFSSPLKIKEKFVVIDTETRTISGKKAYETVKNIIKSLLKKQDIQKNRLYFKRKYYRRDKSNRSNL